ncbi:MAG: glucosamine-6-phosphate deaminase [Mollicutes bacterium]|nr:glucosamine-6-phosphate deaminase [Mollicutes bacterium]
MKFVVCKTPEEIGEKIAKEMIELIQDKPNAILGLATGSSPIPTYKHLIEAYAKGEVSFKEVSSFNLDEYINPPFEEATYRYFMKDNLFSHVDIDLKNTHFPSKENMKEYDEEIVKAGGVDFQILGIGRDGHIGFNEPNTPFDSKTHIAELDESTRVANARFFHSLEETPTEAITMGLSTIMQARHIVMIVSDLSKVDALKALLKGEEDLMWPATVLVNHPSVEVFVTKEVFDASK